MTDRDHLGHEWFIGPSGFTCARCAKARLDGDEQHPCWPPCPDCTKPIVDHNDDPDDPHGRRGAAEFCWRRSTVDGQCPVPTIDWRARALKAERELAKADRRSAEQERIIGKLRDMLHAKAAI